MADRAQAREALALRILWMLLYVLVWGVAETLLVLVIIAQLVLRLVNGEPSRVVAQFGDSLSRYLAHIGRFACFHTEEKPWPFADWPAARELEGEHAGPAPAPAPAPAAAPSTVSPVMATAAAAAVATAVVAAPDELMADEIIEEPATVEELVAEEPEPIEVGDLSVDIDDSEERPA